MSRLRQEASRAWPWFRPPETRRRICGVRIALGVSGLSVRAESAPFPRPRDATVGDRRHSLRRRKPTAIPFPLVDKHSEGADFLTPVRSFDVQLGQLGVLGHEGDGLLRVLVDELPFVRFIVL